MIVHDCNAVEEYLISAEGGGRQGVVDLACACCRFSIAVVIFLQSERENPG